MSEAFFDITFSFYMGNRSENFIHEILLLLWIRSQGFYNKRYYKLRAT